MHKDAAWYGSRPRPRPHCVRGRPTSPAKWVEQAPPIFGPCLLWPRSPISAAAELLFKMVAAAVSDFYNFGDFAIFQNGGRNHLGILKYPHFKGLHGQKCQTKSPFQSLWRSVKPLLKYGDLSFFERREGAQTAPKSQISWQSIKTFMRFGDFQIV